MVVEGINVRVEYETVMFRWSPCILKLTLLTNEYTKVDVNVYDLQSDTNITFSYDLKSIHEIDISRALQLMSEDVGVNIICEGETLTFNLFNINGSKGILEPLGGDYSLRYWDGYPLSVPLLYYDSTTVYKKMAGNIYNLYMTISSENAALYSLASVPVEYDNQSTIELKATGCKFDNGTLTASPWNYKIKRCCIPKHPLYLRWIDKTGLIWHWLFDVVQTTTNIEEDVSYNRFPSSTNTQINSWTTVNNFIVKKKLRLLTTKVTSEEYKVIGTLYTSSIIDAYYDGKWSRVKVTTGENITPTKHYNELEFIIEEAPQKTQLP